MAQVIACIILAQSSQPVPNCTVGHDNLEAQTQITCIAVAQNIHAARVRGKTPANARAAARGQRQREQAIHIFGRLLDIGQNSARIHDHHVFFGINGTNFCHLFEG